MLSSDHSMPETQELSLPLDILSQGLPEFSPQGLRAAGMGPHESLCLLQQPWSNPT